MSQERLKQDNLDELEKELLMEKRKAGVALLPEKLPKAVHCSLSQILVRRADAAAASILCVCHWTTLSLTMEYAPQQQ